MLAPWKKSYDKPSILKRWDITLLPRVHVVKAMVFTVVMYRCESWTIKKAACQKLMLSNCGAGEDENPWDSKEIKPVNSKGNQPWIFIGKSDAEDPIYWSPDSMGWLIGKDPDAGKHWRQEDKGRQRMRESEDGTTDSIDMSLSKLQEVVKDREACSPWNCKELDMTKWLNNNKVF